MDEQTENKFTEENNNSLENTQPLQGIVPNETAAIEPDKMILSIENTELHDMPKSNQIKKYFLYVMIGGLIVSAVISILAVLIGQFNDFMQKSLFTTMSIVVHSLLALAFVPVTVEHQTKVDELIVNTLFGITIASFVTSVLSLWQVLTGSIIGHLYLVFLYALIAAVLCRALLQTNRIDNNTRMLANASVGVTIFLFLLLLPSIFVEVPVLPDIYYRGISATAILLGTTSVLTAVFHRLYINKHPELQPARKVKKQ